MNRARYRKSICAARERRGSGAVCVRSKARRVGSLWPNGRKPGESRRKKERRKRKEKEDKKPAALHGMAEPSQWQIKEHNCCLVSLQALSCEAWGQAPPGLWFRFSSLVHVDAQKQMPTSIALPLDTGVCYRRLWSVTLAGVKDQLFRNTSCFCTVSRVPFRLLVHCISPMI